MSVSFLTLGKFSAIISSNIIFSGPFSLSSPSGSLSILDVRMENHCFSTYAHAFIVLHLILCVTSPKLSHHLTQLCHVVIFEEHLTSKNKSSSFWFAQASLSLPQIFSKFSKRIINPSVIPFQHHVLYLIIFSMETFIFPKQALHPLGLITTACSLSLLNYCSPGHPFAPISYILYLLLFWFTSSSFRFL